MKIMIKGLKMRYDMRYTKQWKIIEFFQTKRKYKE